MNTDILLENVLAYALKQGADACEIFSTAGENHRLVVGEKEVKDREIAVNSGFSLRLLKDNVLGFSYGSELSKEALVKAADKALLSAGFLEPEPLLAFTPTGRKYPDFPSYSPEDISFSQELEFTQAMEKLALEQNLISRVDKATLSMVKGDVKLKNSLGLDLEYSTGYSSCSLVAVAEDGGERETGGEFMATRRFSELNPEKVARRAGFNAANKLHAIRVPGGDYSVVLHSDAVLSLLSVILPGFLGDNIRKGQSVLVDKLGKIIASPEISIYDDPLLSNGIASAPFDDEGTPCRLNTLINRGKVECFLYDNLSAAKAGVKSTGNGFAGSISSMPSGGFSNYYMAGGSSDFKLLLNSADNGLYIRDFMGLHMANSVSGEFSLGISGNVIRNGELKESFRGNMVAGNVFSLLKDVAAVGSEVEFNGYRGAPAILINSMRISGQE